MLYRVLLTICLTVLAPLANAQTNINLGGVTTDSNAPVEVTAENLSVDQDTGKAVFAGNVVVGQGDLRLSAAKVEIVYGDSTGQIDSLSATGGVTFVTATEAAEANSADYNIVGGSLVLTGNVLLTQGASAISADRMQVDLSTGNASLSGNVRTVFQQSDN